MVSHIRFPQHHITNSLISPDPTHPPKVMSSSLMKDLSPNKFLLPLIKPPQNTNIIIIMQAIAEIATEHTNLSGYRIGDYVCSKKLGEGAFACVYKGFNVNNEDEIVAIKVTDKEKYKGGNGDKFLKLLDAEAKAMALCKSEHIVQCYKQYSTKRYVIFILEYCNNGSLFDEIQKRKCIPEPEAKRILKQLIIAFAELHKNNIIHRDLKPENVFKHNQKYKIGDFGFCKIFQSLHDLTRTPLGSLVSMSPEVIDAAPYGIKADLWSLGTVYYEMLYGNPPFISSSYTGMKRQIRKNNIQLQNISKESVNFFERVFVIDPKERLSWTELYSIALFRSPSMVMFDTHQDDPDLDEAYGIHRSIQNMQKEKKYDNAQQHIKQTLLIPPSSAIIQLSDEYDEVGSNIINEYKQREQKLTVRQKEMFMYKDRLNFEMQKSIFIYNEIYNPLSRVGISKKRELAEFNVMILSRCFYIMSPLYDALKNQKNIFKWKFYYEFLKDSNQKSFLKDFQIHYKQIKTAQNTAFEVLSEIEGKKTEQVKDFFRRSIFGRSQFREERTFLDGVENLDYTAERHTEFIVNNHLKAVLEGVWDIVGYNKNQLRTLNRALENYGRIALLAYEEGKGKERLREIYDDLKLNYEDI